MSKKKVNYPKKKHRITLEDVEDVSEPERRSMYHVLLDNLRTFNRATFLHRIIYVGNHKFNSYEDARNIFSINIAKCNETYCIEKLSGFFLFYYKYFVHMVEGDEDNLNKHLGYLLDNDAHYYEKLGTIKLLIHVSNINQRFFEDWIPYTEAPSKLLEKLNIDADLQQSGRYIFNCIKKLYGLMNTFAGDLFTCNDPIGEQNSSSNYDIASINSKETSLTSKTYASVSYSSHMGSLDFNLAETNQREYKLFLPEYELLDFIIHSNFTMNLKEYFGIYGVVPMRTIYKDKIWPVPHDFIPYDVFEKPYDCVTELPKDVRKKHHIDISSLSCNVQSLSSIFDLPLTKAQVKNESSESEMKNSNVSQSVVDSEIPISQEQVDLDV
ncbi:hypothetical protein ABEB36_014924 [Hypothenemus hampei]|uniref:Uncharacterized protein n=1 Tax=Hypothenemus hampei TaxID=57062 RepID=A0ABD1E198_HYPHA